jgi:hypothetical protein
VYTVDLPPWIPDDILQKMVTEFRDCLFRELVLMMDDMAQPAPERKSMESDSCLSTASNESAPDTTDREEWVRIVLKK